jgi:hypothetical protein
VTGNQDQRYCGEQFRRVNKAASTFGAGVTGFLMPGDCPGNRLVERNIAGHGGGQTVTQRPTVPPEEIGTDGVAKLGAQPVELLMGVVCLDAQFFCDFGGPEPVS